MRGWPFQGRKAKVVDKTEIIRLSSSEVDEVYESQDPYEILQKAVIEYAFKTGHVVQVDIMEEEPCKN